MTQQTISSHGYILVLEPTSHLADVRGYVYKHRLVAEEKIGRKLKTGEIVHHIDGNKQNNSPDNLTVTNSLKHHKANHRGPGSKLRKLGENNPKVKCECGCGETFLKYDSYGRPRRFIKHHNTKKRTHNWSSRRKPDSKCKPLGAPNYKIFCACGCGTELLKYDTGGRPRKYISGHNNRKDIIK